MIFFDGEIYENDMCDKLLARFEDRICCLLYTSDAADDNTAV